MLPYIKKSKALWSQQITGSESGSYSTSRCTKPNMHVLGISKHSLNPRVQDTLRSMTLQIPPRRWDTAMGMASKAPHWSTSVSVMVKKANRDNIFEVVTLLGSIAQSKRWSISSFLSKGLLSRWQCPFHILWACFRGQCLKDQCRGVCLKHLSCDIFP